MLAVALPGWSFLIAVIVVSRSILAHTIWSLVQIEPHLFFQKDPV